MDKISSLLEESSESSFDPFGSNAGTDAPKAGVVPPREKKGLSEASVTRTSGFYSIQKAKRKERPTRRSKTNPKLIQETRSEEPRKRKVSGTYSIAKTDKPIHRDRVSSQALKAVDLSPTVSSSEPNVDTVDSTINGTGSYQLGKSEGGKRSEEVVLAGDIVAPRPASRLKQTFEKILGRKPEAPVEDSGQEWFGDKPEGDKYWTVAADDSQRDDHSIWTLLMVFVILTVLFGVLLWLLLG